LQLISLTGIGKESTRGLSLAFVKQPGFIEDENNITLSVRDYVCFNADIFTCARHVNLPEFRKLTTGSGNSPHREISGSEQNDKAEIGARAFRAKA
jgi:hypothetical protein